MRESLEEIEREKREKYNPHLAPYSENAE